MGDGEQGVSQSAERWLRRPFAATFDLILSEYAGYTDETLLDVTLGRLHQMREVILERKALEHRRMLEVEEAKLRNLCTSIWGAAGSKDGVKQSSRIELYQREKQIVVADESAVRRMFGG